MGRAAVATISVLLVLGACAAPAPRPTPPKEVPPPAAPVASTAPRIDAAEHELEAGHNDAAAILAQQVLDDATAAAGSKSVALRILAAVDAYAGRLDQAATRLERAITLAEGAGALGALGSAQVSLGDLKRTQGDLTAAQTLMEAGVATLRRSDDRGDLAHALNSLGVAYSDREPERSLQMLTEAYTLATDLAEPVAQANALTNIGVYYFNSGRYAEAQRRFEQALALRRSAAIGGEQYDLANLGAISWELRDLGAALASFRAALAIDRAGADQLGEVDDLSNIGMVLRQQGDAAGAMQALDEGLRLARASGYRHAEVFLLKNLGDLQLQAGEVEQALRTEREAIAVGESNDDPVPVAACRISMTDALLRLGRAREAQEVAVDALVGAVGVGAAQIEWQADHALFRSLVAQRAPAAAILFGKEAVRVLQGIRSANRELPEELKASYVERVRAVYEGVIDALIRQGRLGEAEEILDMLKLREYRDFLRGADDIAVGAPSLGAAEAVWSERLAGIRTTVRDGAGAVEAQAAFGRALEQIGAEMRGATPATPGPTAAHDFLERLGPGVALVHYVVARDRLHILLTLPRAQVARGSAVTASDLRTLALRFRKALKNPRSLAQPMAQELYRLLIAPIENDLRQAGTTTLMVSLDEALRYLPLAALHSGRHWLIEDYAIAVFTPAAAAGVTAPDQPDWKAAALGVSHAAPGFEALPAVPFELRGIVTDGTDATPAGELPGVIRLDTDFTEAALAEVLAQHYPVVHIASHFNLVPGAGLSSFLLLGDERHLTLEDFQAGRFSLTGIDLLTLSACNTAVATTASDGAEVEGFAALAQRKGARSVIASLWSVSDASTGLLMRAFYHYRVQGRRSKAQALRRAQIAMITGVIGPEQLPEKLRSSRDAAVDASVPASLAHPFYWAPFVLMGNSL